MFYVDFLFSKKSPLSRIWLAAHFDKRLTKSQIIETDIVHVIDEILNPQVKIAIRLSGHLLYGVSKIYHQKASYILSEASEYVMKQMSERKLVSIDLPPNEKAASHLTLDLSDVGCFNHYLSHLQNEKKMASLDHHHHHLGGGGVYQSRVEDITLKDHYHPSLSLLANDSANDAFVPPFDEEVMRSFIGGMEESTYEVSRFSQTMLRAQPTHSPSHQLEHRSFLDNTSFVKADPQPMAVLEMDDVEPLNIELPPEPSMISLPPDMNPHPVHPPPTPTDALAQTESRRKRKTKVLMDTETMLSSEMMRNHLSDCGPILKNMECYNLHSNESCVQILRDITNTYAFGVVSQKLCTIMEKLEEASSKRPYIPTSPERPSMIMNSSLPRRTINNDVVIESLDYSLLPDFEPPIPLEPNDTAPSAVSYDAAAGGACGETTHAFSVNVTETWDELSTILLSMESTTFQEFTTLDQKSVACRKFVSLLHLHKSEVVHLDQKSPYESINISCTARSRLNITTV